jgi:hypothetical protein
MTQREKTGFDVWKEQKTVTTRPALFQQVQMSRLTIQRTCGNSVKWLVPELFSVRMINVTITPDMGCGMQVLGWETTRWPSFIRWVSKSRREAFSAVFAVKDPTALVLARKRSSTCILRLFYPNILIESLCQDWLCTWGFTFTPSARSSPECL